MAYDKFAAVDSGTLLFPPTVRANLAAVSPNYIINGAFDIWQRGTSFASTAYSSDRWKAQVSGTCTHSQESTTVPDGARYCHKWVTGASSSYGQIRQWIETATVVALRGKTVTASAYVKVSAGLTGTIGFEIAYSTTTDTESGFSGTSPTQTATTTSSTSWTRITSTFVVPTNAVGLYIGLVPSAVQASGVTVYMGNVQLEDGAVATPFRRNANSIQGELAACQRYYIRYTGPTNGTRLIFGVQNTNTTANAAAPLPVEMRTVPSSLEYSNIAWTDTVAYDATISNISFNNSGGSNKTVNLYPTFAANGAARYPGYLFSSAIGGYIGFSAEL